MKLKILIIILLLILLFACENKKAPPMKIEFSKDWELDDRFLTYIGNELLHHQISILQENKLLPLFENFVTSESVIVRIEEGFNIYANGDIFIPVKYKGMTSKLYDSIYKEGLNDYLQFGSAYSVCYIILNNSEMDIFLNYQGKIYQEKNVNFAGKNTFLNFYKYLPKTEISFSEDREAATTVINFWSKDTSMACEYFGLNKYVNCNNQNKIDTVGFTINVLKQNSKIPDKSILDLYCLILHLKETKF